MMDGNVSQRHVVLQSIIRHDAVAVVGEQRRRRVVVVVVVVVVLLDVAAVVGKEGDDSITNGDPHPPFAPHEHIEAFHREGDAGMKSTVVLFVVVIVFVIEVLLLFVVVLVVVVVVCEIVEEPGLRERMQVDDTVADGGAASRRKRVQRRDAVD